MSASMDGEENDPNLTPLLDVVMQLVMFFMITVNFVRTEHINPEIVLPVVVNAVPMDAAAEDWVYLNINKDGKLVGTAEQLEPGQKLKAYLMKEKEALDRVSRARGKGDAKVVVVIRAHKDARYEKVWDVLHSCEQAGFKRWQIRGMTRA